MSILYSGTDVSEKLLTIKPVQKYMNSKKTFMTVVLVAALPMAALTSCSSDNDEQNGGSAGEGLDNEVVLSMLKGGSGNATMLDDMYIGEDNNFQSAYSDVEFALMPNAKKLSGITNIPKSGWAEKVAVRKGYGYVCCKYNHHHNPEYYTDNSDFYRIYVEDEMRDTEGKLIGYNIRYQHPFYGKDIDIQLPKDELSFTDKGGREEVKFLDNEPIYFSCVSSADWCKVTTTSSFSKYFLTNAVDVSVEASDTVGVSTATIILTTGYGKKKEIKVTRGAAEPRMMLYNGYDHSFVTSMNLPVPLSRANKSLYVKSNIPLKDIDIENTASDWCEAKLVKDADYGDGYKYVLIITTTANETDAKRTGTITLKYRNGDTSVKLDVEQEAPYIKIDNGYSEDNPFTIDYYSSSAEINFRTNIDRNDLKVANSASWLTTSFFIYDPYSDYCMGCIRLYSNSKNNSSTDREDIVTISNKKCSVSCSFKVKQRGY